jgi:hypothetical protein
MMASARPKNTSMPSEDIAVVSFDDIASGGPQ